MPVVHPPERSLFAASLLASVGVYVGLAVLAPEVLLYVTGFAALGLCLLGWSIGQVRANGVRVSEVQLPEVHRIAVELAHELGLSRLPAIYVVQAGGALNAFAASFVRRDFVVLYSDVADLATEGREAELAFVIAHELTHIRRRHPRWSWALTGSHLIPFLSSAYSRACEHTCDLTAAALRPDGAPGGLLVLAAGKRLARRVDPLVFADQRRTENGFWLALVEVTSSHPSLPTRVAALERRGAFRPASAAPAARVT